MYIYDGFSFVPLPETSYLTSAIWLSMGQDTNLFWGPGAGAWGPWSRAQPAYGHGLMLRAPAP